MRPLPVSPLESHLYILHIRYQVMRIDWKPIILWGGGAGALVAFWAGLWITGFLMAWGEGWLHPGIELPARYSEHLRLPPEVAPGWSEDLIGCDLPGRLSGLLMLITGLGVVAGAAVASVGRLLKLDPGLVALKSFWWLLFVVPSMFFFWLGVARFAVFTLALDRGEPETGELMAEYEEMADDKAREAEALDWTESTSYCLHLP